MKLMTQQNLMKMTTKEKTSLKFQRGFLLLKHSIPYLWNTTNHFIMQQNYLNYFIIFYFFLAKPIQGQNSIQLTKENYHQILKSSNESIKNQLLKDCIKRTYRAKDWELFHKCRLTHIAFTKKIEDSSALAKTLEYSGSYFRNNHKLDSAYYYYTKSFVIFDALKDSVGAGRVLLNNAIIQKNVSDYIGGEATTFKALGYLQSGDNLRRISSAHNNLGIIYNNLKDIDNSLKYHSKAFELRKQIKGKPLYHLHSLNNIGKALKDNGKYDNAIINFQKVLNYDSLLIKYPKFWATVTDNLGHTYFKNDKTEQGLELMTKALRVREVEKDSDGIIINAIHLAEFHAQVGDTATAINFARRAEQLSESIKNYRDYLASHELMANLYRTDQAKEHFAKYVSIRDSLDLANRRYKDQFARYKFELDEKEAELIINKENLKRNKYAVLFLSLLGLAIIIVFLKYRWNQRKLQKTFNNGFRNHLIKKYKLTSQNIEFWELWITGIDQKTMADKLFISIDAVKSRRKSLRKKIDEIEGDFTQAKAICIFRDEKEGFVKFTKKNSSK